MDVGKVYQHPKGGIVQILTYNYDQDLVEVYHIPTKKIYKFILSSFLLEWEGRATHLPDHPGIGRPCEDCGEFCRQQCQTLPARITKAANKYTNMLVGALNREQADRVMEILLRDLKTKNHG